jgi:putative nucleotidyltransferase with HDIG domain
MNLKKNIMIVDDEPDLLDLLVDLFSDKHQVVQATDGQQALEMFTAGRYDLVISDIRMPKMSGVELLKAIKSKGATPVILMTGFSELLETQSAYDLGADEFISKPFKPDDLVKLAEGFLDNSRRPESNIDGDFCKIHVDELQLGSQAIVDIYFRLSHKKYLKIIKVGKVIERDRVKAYIARGLVSLFVTRDDFAKYVGMNLKMARERFHDENLGYEAKQKSLNLASESLLQQIYKTGLNQDRYKESKDLVERSLSLVKAHNDLDTLLLSLNSHSDDLYAHSLGVSMYASVIARTLGWSSPVTLSRISMAGLFHDIGLKEIDKFVLEKTRKEMSSDERREFESHCLRGRDILKSIQGIPDEIAMVAYQHHENSLGLGYPAKAKRQQIHPIARLVQVADLFCDRTVKSQYTLPMEPPAALAEIHETHMQEIEPIYLGALYKAFDVEMPPDVAKIWSTNSDHKI